MIYRSDDTPVWSTGTFDISPNVARMQSDGNFVVYDTANTPHWHTHTYGNPGAYLSMQNNGAFVINTRQRRAALGKPRCSQRSEYAAGRRRHFDAVTGHAGTPAPASTRGRPSSRSTGASR